jgi:hypothetical protein
MSAGTGPLGAARDAFADSAAELSKVAELFPFRSEPGDVEDDLAIGEAVPCLKAAREADMRARKALGDALAEWPDE